MTRQMLSAFAIACAVTVAVAAQTPSTSQTPPTPAAGVTFSGCIERDSAGPTGTGTLGNAAANPATLQGAFKLVKVEAKDAAAAASAKSSSQTDTNDKVRDIRVLAAPDAKVNLAQHVGHKVELTGGFSNSPETTGTGVAGSGQGGSGTGGTALNPRSGTGERASTDPREAMRKMFSVTALKMISACDAK